VVKNNHDRCEAGHPNKIVQTLPGNDPQGNITLKISALSYDIDDVVDGLGITAEEAVAATSETEDRIWRLDDELSATFGDRFDYLTSTEGTAPGGEKFYFDCFYDPEQDIGIAHHTSLWSPTEECWSLMVDCQQKDDDLPCKNEAFMPLKREAQWFGENRLAASADRVKAFSDDIADAKSALAICPNHQIRSVIAGLA
jgi:hypothetical protein